MKNLPFVSRLFSRLVTAIALWGSIVSLHAEVIVQLEAASLPEGDLDIWENSGSVGGDFTAETLNGVVETIDGAKGVTLDGSTWYVGPSAPESVTGSNSRSVEAWVYNPEIASEETVFAWGRRNGPNGTNASFNHGTNTDFGAVGHWGGQDIGWEGTEEAEAWNHIAYTWNSDSLELAVYKNGEQVNSDSNVSLNTWAVDDAGAPLPFVVGAQNEADGSRSGGRAGSMTIGLVRVYDDALSSSAVQRIFNQSATTFGMERNDRVIVELNATSLKEGELEIWRNTGSLGGEFEAEVDPSIVEEIDGVRGVTLDGDNDWYIGPETPDSVTGSTSRTVEAWIYNPAIADEETVFSWGRRGGPDGTNVSVNHGSNGTFGAVGHWGGADIGWNSTQKAGEWTAIGYTWDADSQTTTVYTNGVVANTATGISLDTASEDENGDPLVFVVGNQNELDGTRTNALSGSLSIAILRVRDTAIDAEAIQANYLADSELFGKRDSDGDGIPDVVEDLFDFLDKDNAADATMDQDEDGLSNIDEIENGTNMEVADSDEDGFSDGEEVAIGSDPLDEDSTPDDFDRGKLVDLDATSLPVGALETWMNIGSVTGDFMAEIDIPEVQTIDEINAVVLDGDNDWYVGPAAPPSVTGNEGSRTVEAWVHNAQIANEETVFSWGSRGGPEGTNTAFNHGSNALFGAVGHWGAPDIGWENTQKAQEWTYIAYTWDASTSTTTVYTNGEVANTETNIFLSTNAVDSIGDPLPFVVGNQNEAGGGRTNDLSGSMAIGRVRVHGTALDSATILATYNSEKGFFNADNDGDGLPNAYEALFAFLDPDNGADAGMDFDEDGLTALQEFEAGTDPGKKDTDDDGLDDNDELSRVPLPTNPTIADTDRDGIKDGVEINTDPLNADSDEDGFVDGQEIVHNSNPTDAASTPDFSTPVAVISLNATNLPDGDLEVWPNTGAIEGDFVSETETPGVVMEVDGRRGVELDGTNWYVGPAAPVYLAPGENDGGNRTITAWVYNPDLAGEETVFAWGRRNGPDGSNTSFNHGSSPDFGAVGHWGGPDIGWNGTEIAGEWTHIAYSWGAESETTTVYTDGEIADSEEGILLATWGQDSNGAPLPFVVGNQNEIDGTRTPALSAMMTISEIRVYDQELTDEQIVEDLDGTLDSGSQGSFQILDVVLTPGAAADTVDITVTWESRDGEKYTVSTNEDLEGEWTEQADGVDSEGTMTSFTNSGVSTSIGELYYRIIRE